MTVIGVTGGIGSGKSTVCRMLAERGARVFNADLEARQIMEGNGRVRRELIAVLGRGIYRPGPVLGRDIPQPGPVLDRPLVAARLFADENLLAKVNAIVHPRVRRAFAAARRRALADGVPVLVKEAALLLDSGSTDELDLIVVVIAPAGDRIRRVVDRDNGTEASVRARMEHQRSEAEFMAAADYVVENDGTLEDLAVLVEALWAQLNALGGIRSLGRRATEQR